MRAGATPEVQNPYRAVDQLGRVLVQIENDYVDPVERGKLVEGAIKGMVENLDPHSSYMPPEEWKEFQNDSEGKFGGVGLEVDGRGGRLVVIAPIDGSPAARAGIMSGDQIVAIDGKEVASEGLDSVVKKMRGAAGTKVKVTVLRRSKGPTARELQPVQQTLTFELTREIIHVSSVTYKLLRGNVGYLRIKQFQERAHAETMAAVAKLRAEAKGSLSGVLLDVRSNPGGLVDEATEIADEFLASGGIYSMRHRGQVIENLSARDGGALVSLPCVALVNEWSASASELLVGALQDNQRATVIGTNTFGKGSVQSVLPLPFGAGLKLTTARYYTPSGHAIQADGIHPDLRIEAKTSSDALRVIRERDLPGHLVAEGTEDAGANRTIVVDAGTGEVDGFQVARDVPVDPATSTDIVLRVGYETLAAKIGASRPLPR